MTIMTTLIGQKETEQITLQLHCDSHCEPEEYYFKMYKQFTEVLVEIFIYRSEVQYYCTLNVKTAKDMQILIKMLYTANHIYTHFDEYIHQLTP